jgi:hypothetical protein
VIKNMQIPQLWQIVLRMTTGNHFNLEKKEILESLMIVFCRGSKKD